MSVKLYYYWKHSGDQGQQVLASRNACWSALI